MSIISAKQYICIWLCILFTISSSQTVSLSEKELYVDKITNALRSALHFFLREHMFIILDAIVGTRMVEGQTKALMEKVRSRQNIDPRTFNRIREINHIAGEASDRAIPYVAMKTPVYYRSYVPIVRRGFWESDFPFQNLPENVPIWIFRANPGTLMDGTTDRCIGELIGTRSERCNMSPSCWRNMTSSGYKDYTLSNQQMYLTIGQLSGCSFHMERMRIIHAQQSVSHISVEMCANMIAEANIISNNGYQDVRRDLFLEIGALCGMIGIRETFRGDWLDRILSWQDSVLGCYSDNITGPWRNVNRRKKRSERRHRNGCLSHLTAVAVGALTQYLRYILLDL